MNLRTGLYRIIGSKLILHKRRLQNLGKRTIQQREKKINIKSRTVYAVRILGKHRDMKKTMMVVLKVSERNDENSYN